MNIALINSEHPQTNGAHGGIASLNYTLANAFAKCGHRVHLLLREGTVPDTLCSSIQIQYYEFKPSSSPIKHLDRLFRNGAMVWERGHSRHLREILLQIDRDEKLDTALIPDYGGMAHQMHAPLPFTVVTIFCMPSQMVDQINQVAITATRRKQYLFEAKAITRASGYVCFMPSIIPWLSKRYSPLRAEITTIKTPVDTTILENPKPLRDTENRNLLFAGRLEHRKGAGIILESIKKILECDSRIQMTFAGQTDCGGNCNYQKEIERILTPEENQRVTFCGHLKRDLLYSLYKESYALIVPSLFDNCPNTLLEAMAAGLAIIGSDATGIADFITHEENGLLFPLSSPLKIVDHIKRIVSDEALACRLGKNAFTYVKEQHSPDSIVGDYTKLFQSINTRSRKN